MCTTSMFKIEQKKGEGRVQMGLCLLSQMSYHPVYFLKAIETQFKFIICPLNVNRKFLFTGKAALKERRLKGVSAILNFSEVL